MLLSYDRGLKQSKDSAALETNQVEYLPSTLRMISLPNGVCRLVRLSSFAIRYGKRRAHSYNTFLPFHGLLRLEIYSKLPEGDERDRKHYDHTHMSKE